MCHVYRVQASFYTKFTNNPLLKVLPKAFTDRSTESLTESFVGMSPDNAAEIYVRCRKVKEKETA